MAFEALDPHHEFIMPFRLRGKPIRYLLLHGLHNLL